jgi:hypothetical protein
VRAVFAYTKERDVWMRAMTGIFALVLIYCAPHTIGAQTVRDSREPVLAAGERRPFTIGVAGGSTIEGGSTGAASFGYALNRRLTLLVGVDRLHLPTKVEHFDRGSAATRGGTSTLLTGELQVQLLPDRRPAPYLIVGAGAGISRPNVNAIFPDRVTNRMGMLFSGAGLRVPLARHLALFGEVRLALAAERDSLLFSVPIRGGVSWRF